MYIKRSEILERGVVSQNNLKIILNSAFCILHFENMSKLYPKVVPGAVIKVHQKIKETNAKGEEKERVQIFEGMVLARRGNGISETITVRKVSEGVGVEKIYPLAMPSIENIEVGRQAKVKHAKLYYLRTYPKKLKFDKEEKHTVAKTKKSASVKTSADKEDKKA